MTRSELLGRVFIPIASKDDARTTAHAVLPYLNDTDGYAVVGNVIEKAGGAPDKASVEQREEYAEELFAIVEEIFAEEQIPHEFHVLYGTDVAERIIEAADEFGTTSIAFTPRGGSRWVHLLAGDVTHKLANNTDRPIIVLPDSAPEDADG
jgi:nucleotide-binding universal stress UspA family protein